MASSLPAKAASAAAAALALTTGALWLDATHNISWDARLILLSSRLQSTLGTGAFNFGDYFIAACSKNPNKVFLRFEDHSFTYAQIDQLTNRSARWFHDQGLKKGDIAVLGMENRPEFLFILYGALKAGVICALANTGLTGASLVHCMKIVNPKIAIFGTEVAESFLNIRGDPAIASVRFYQCGTLYPLAAAPKATGDIPFMSLAIYQDSPVPQEWRHPTTANDPGAFIYTSGTTGLPKAAVISHGRWLAGAFGFGAAFGVTSDDVVYSPLPLFHSAAGLIGVGMALTQGGTFVLRRKFSAREFWSDCKKYDATVVQYIGELCRYLVNSPPSPHDRAHKVRLAVGNGLRPDIWETFYNRFGLKQIGEFYAATEGNAPLFHLYQGGHGAGAVGKLGSIVRTVAKLGTLVKFDVEKEEPIRDANGFCIPAEINEPGELLGFIDRTRLNSDFQGYYNNPEATKKKVMNDVFVKGDSYFRTGDLLKRDEKGLYYFVDRIGDTFRWKGENVSTNEVAEAVSKFPGVVECNVFGLPLPGVDGQAGVAAVILDESKFDITKLKAHLSKVIPEYAHPLFIRVLQSDGMVITGTFKHRKVELRQQGIKEDVKDKFWVLEKGKYVPLTPEARKGFLGGNVKAKL